MTVVNETQEVETKPTPQPEKLNEQQIKYFTTLIQDNPLYEPWPGKIDEIKNLYSKQLPDTAIPFSNEEKDRLSKEKFKNQVLKRI